MGDIQRNGVLAGRIRWAGGRVSSRVLLGIFIFALALLGAARAGTHPAAASGRPPGGNLSDAVVREVDVASPAAVRLATIYYGHVTLALARCGQQVTLPTTGPGYATGGLGSGAFVSANGDILTADHVVNIDRQSLDAELFQEASAAQDIAQALNACYTNLPTPITASDVAAGIVSQSGIAFTTTYSAPRFLAWRDTAWSGQLASTSATKDSILAGLLSTPYMQATIIRSSDFAQDDLALLHVNLTDTPSILLGNSADVAVQDRLTVVGFPGNGDFSNDPTDLLTVSVNNAAVSAIKQNDNGSQLIQIGGNVERGDSGGPALDVSGQIVGVVSFGGTDTPGITSFLRSSDSARKLITSAGIATTPGTFQTLWQQAFEDYAATTPGHWHKAAQQLQTISARYPGFQAVLPYLRYAQVQAAQEPLTTPGPTTPRLSLPVIGGAGIVALLAIMGMVALAVRSRRKRQAAAFATVPAGTPFSAYGAPPPGYAYPTMPPAYGAPSDQMPPGRMPAFPSGPLAPYAAPSGPVAPLPPDGPSAPASWPEQQAIATAAPTNPWMSPAICLNGHQMAPGVVSCGVCGAPRRTTT
ncbi:MAG: trypsin-like peptidase domain-containing protein [Ktedonobacterales bacterium]|nr:trypsin-like peptidase domain-containing protein [Ktedonobacterales bacterium]